MRGSSHSRKALEAARASEGYFNVDLSANFSPQGNKMSSSSGTPPPRSAEEDGGALSNSKRQSTSLSSTTNGSVSPPAVARSTNSHHSHRLRAPQLHLLPNQEDLVEVPGVVERNPSPSPYVVVESTPSNVVASGSSTATAAAHQSHLLKSTKPALVASAMTFPMNASSAESGKRGSSSGGGTNHYPSSSLLLHHSGNSSSGDLYDFQSPISFSPTSHAMTSNSSRKPAATSPKPALRTMPTTVPQQTVPARHNNSNNSSSSSSSSSGLYPHQGIFVVGGANRNYKAPVLLEEQEARPRPSRPRLLPMPATATNYPGAGIPTSTSVQSPAMKASSMTSPRLRAATPPATPGSLARAREVDFAQRTGGGGGGSSTSPTTPPADPFSLDDFPSDPNEPRQSTAATAGSSHAAGRASSSSLHDWDLIHEDDSNSNRLVAQKEGSGPYHIGKEAQGGEEDEEDRWASSSSLEMHGRQSLEQLEKMHQPVHYQQQQQQHYGSDPHTSSYVPQSSPRIPDVFLAPSAAPPPHPQPPLLYRDQSGFLNSGNTCYAASVLTMLLRQPRVQKGLAAFVKEYGSLRTTVLKEIITTEYREEVVTVGGGGIHDTSLYGGTQEVPASLPQDQAARLASEETQRGDGSSLSDYWSRPYGHLPSSGYVPPPAAPAPQKTYVRRVPVQRTDMETLKVPIAALHLALYRCCQKMRRIAKAQQDENRAHFEQKQQRHNHSSLLYPEAAVVEEEQAASVPCNLWLTSLQSEERQGDRGATENQEEEDDNPLGSDGADTSSSSSNYSTDRDDDEEEEAARRFTDEVFDDDDNKGTRKKGWRRRPKVEGIDMKHVAEALGDESLFFDAQQHDAHEFFVAILARLESEAIDAMQKAKYLTHRKAQVLYEQRMKRQLQEPLGGGGDSEVVPPPPTPNLKKRDIVIDPNDVWINKLFRGSVLNIISCRQSQCGHQIVAHDPFVNLTTAALSKSQLQLKTQHEEALQKRRQEQLQLRRQQQQQMQQSTLHRFAGPWNSHPYHQYSSPAAAAASTAATNLPPVPVVKIEPGSLRTLIRESFQSDALDSYKCDQCKSSTSNFQAGCLETAPPLLVVQVKRFEGFYDKVRSLFLQKKLSIRITMDDDLWIVAREAAQACGDGGGTVRQFQYRLRSVLFHSGSSLEAGHYICSFSVPLRTATNAETTTTTKTSNENTRPTNDVFTRMTTTTTTATAAAINHRPIKEPHPDKSVWYLADDEVVRQLPPAEGQGPLHATGYMMLYELISMRVREDRCVVPPPPTQGGGGGGGAGGGEGSRKRERSPSNSPPPPHAKQDGSEGGGGSPRKQTEEEVERGVENSNGEYFVDDPNAPSSEHWSWRVQFPPLV